MASELEIKTYPPDFTPENIQELEEYRANGIPGIPSDPNKIKEIKKLYMDGMSFKMISNRTRTKRVAVLFLAEKYKWYEERESGMIGMLESISKRADVFQVQHVHFVIELCDAIRTYYLDKINRFAETKDPSIMEDLNGTLMNIYTKCQDSLRNKKKDDDDMPKSPLVGITLGNGATLSVPEENKGDLSKVLKTLADMNRKKDNQQGESNE